jgi:hypothetical protein
VEAPNRHVRIVICPECGQRLTVESAPLPAPVTRDELLYYPTRWFVLGRIGEIRLAHTRYHFAVVGRVRYADERNRWDEWYLELLDHTVIRLDEEAGRHTLYREPPLPVHGFEFSALHVGNSWLVGGQQFFVLEKRRAQVVAAEGEAPPHLQPQQTVRLLCGTVAGRPAAFRETGGTTEFRIGEGLEPGSILLDEAMF